MTRSVRITDPVQTDHIRQERVCGEYYPKWEPTITNPSNRSLLYQYAVSRARLYSVSSCVSLLSPKLPKIFKARNPIWCKLISLWLTGKREIPKPISLALFFYWSPYTWKIPKFFETKSGITNLHGELLRAGRFNSQQGALQSRGFRSSKYQPPYQHHVIIIILCGKGKQHPRSAHLSALAPSASLLPFAIFSYNLLLVEPRS